MSPDSLLFKLYIKAVKPLIIRFRAATIHDPDISLVSNNCIGADIAGECGLRYNSPTMNLQIPPPDFIKFCANPKHYLTCELVELHTLTEDQEQLLDRLYGKCSDQLGMPLALCGDILIIFQHYKTFAEGKAAWDKRRSRVNLQKCGYILIIDETWADVLPAWDSFQPPAGKKLLFSLNFTRSGAVPVTTPPDVHFMQYQNRKKYYQQNIDVVNWVRQIPY